MATLNEIKSRIQGIKNTQKITKAMKVVATTRLKKNERLLSSANHFMETLEDALLHLEKSEGKLEHPLMLKNQAPHKVAVVLISSDRGLCGSFNSILLRLMVESLRKETAAKQDAYFLLGSKGRQFFKNRKAEILYEASNAHEADRVRSISAVVDQFVSLYQQNKISEARLVFNYYQSRANYGFKALQLLPFDCKNFVKREFKKEGGSFLIEPDVPTSLEFLIPLFLKSFLGHAILQSQTAEEFSRMLAMDYATENANELISELSLAYNRRRQEVITKEISEIVGGAEALK